MKRTLPALAALLLAPAPAAQAAEMAIGSDLSAPATAARSDPNDIVFWDGGRPGAAIDVPVAGQAIIMRLKGGTQQPAGAPADPGLYDLMHFVVLRPAGDGTWRTTATSAGHRAPVMGAGADARTVSTYTSPNPLCVQPGDRIGLATVGGFHPQAFLDGLPYQVFGEVPGTMTHEFRAGGAIDEGATVIRGTRVPDTELLLQVVIGTGPDARPACGGSAPSGSDPGTSPGSSEPPPRAVVPGSVQIPKPARAPRLFDGKIRLTLRCAEVAECSGVLSLRAKGKRIGRRAYRLDAGETDGVSVRLSRAGRRMARRAGRLRVTARVTTEGGPTRRRAVTVHA